MVVCVSPSIHQSAETHNNLMYASGAARIRNKPEPNYWNEMLDGSRVTFLEHRVRELEEQLVVALPCVIFSILISYATRSIGLGCEPRAIEV